MKKGLLFLVLIMTLSVFGVGSVNAEGVTGFILPIKEAQQNYDKCLNDNNKDTVKCLQQKTILEDSIAAGNSDIKNLQDNLDTSKNAFVECLKIYNGNTKLCEGESLALTNAEKAKEKGTPFSNPNYNYTACEWRGVTGGIDFLACADSLVARFIQVTLLKYAQIFLYFSAMMLNESIRFAIFDADGSVSRVIAGLYPIWQLIRQLVDYCVLFATLYLGAMYIMNIEAGKHFIEKHIPWLILFALFVNFSYPATKALKDISNIISLKIYASTVPGALNSSLGAGDTIMMKLGLPKLASVVTDSGTTEAKTDLFTNNQSTLPSLLLFIMIMFISFIFIIIAFMMIMSSIVCIFIITVSPILLIQKIVPQLDKVASQLREEFWKMLILPIVFTLMFFLTTQIITRLNLPVSYSAEKGNMPVLMQMFNVVIIIASVWVMFIATKSVSGKFGSTVEGWAGKAAGLAMMATPAGALRMTAGRLGAGMLNSNTAIGGWIDKNRGTMLGDSFHKLGGGLANSTYDMRNVKGMRDLAGMGGIKEMGEGSTETFKKTLSTKTNKLAKDFSETKSLEGKQRLLNNVGKYSLLSHEKDYVRKNLGEELAREANKEIGKKKKEEYDNSSKSEQWKKLGDDQEEAMKMQNDILSGKITTKEASKGPNTNINTALGGVILPEDREREEKNKRKLDEKIASISEEYKNAVGEDKQKIYEKYSNYSDSADIHEALQGIDRDSAKDTFEYDHKNTFEGDMSATHDEARAMNREYDFQEHLKKEAQKENLAEIKKGESPVNEEAITAEAVRVWKNKMYGNRAS